MLLSKGILVDGGKTWFWLNKNGEHCEMISTVECLIPIKAVSAVLANYGQRKSRFPMGFYRPTCLEFKIHRRERSIRRFEEVAFGHRHGFQIVCRSCLLSPETTYAIYLVFKLQENHSAPWPPVKVHISLCYGYPSHTRYTYLVCPQTPILRAKDHQNTHNPSSRPKIESPPRLRNDGWMEVQVWEFRTDTIGLVSENLRLTFFDKNLHKGLIVEGVEFKPI
ncbi:hypothetical protein L1887_27536 [Cichorium endivia]|nr:hypothetical protein L1887_27536 [Cichorium endivia]